MKVAIGYIRVSTAGQSEEGVSLEAQEAKIKDWCKLNGYQLDGILKDNGISGCKLGNRPKAQKAILLTCERKGALVVYSLARLCRSTKDAIEISDRLSKAGADLVSLSEQIDTTTATGKMIFRLLAVLAEFERDLLSERTKSALRQIKANGKRTGGIPYGYQLDMTRPETRIKHGKEITYHPYLIPDQNEQKVLAEIIRLYEAGFSMAMIKEELHKKGIKARNGKSWHITQIRRLILRHSL